MGIISQMYVFEEPTRKMKHLHQHNNTAQRVLDLMIFWNYKYKLQKIWYTIQLLYMYINDN